MTEFGECGTCKAPVVWALTATGAASPVDVDPSAEGNTLLLSPTGFGAVLSIVLSKGALERARANRVPLRLNHWATCPDREEWRRRAGRKRAGAQTDVDREGVD